MKHTEERPYADPEAAARMLLELVDVVLMSPHAADQASSYELATARASDHEDFEPFPGAGELP
ncbi:hypothetical protein ACT4MK_22200 [Bradyrhizobium barranii]|uniref:hypothetical protein n=1 Tax=Bradyrhizobium barranii TaxID=2992140 RepID=UPI0040345687